MFGLGGLVIGLVIAPILWIVLRRSTTRERLTRRIIGYGCGAFVRVMRILGVLQYTIDGIDSDRVPTRCLIVANHPSLIDVVFILAKFPDAVCVVKASHWKNPFTMAAVRAANYIANADPVSLIEESVARLRNDERLILFPEGTRTPPDSAPTFGRGAASIALRARADCLPIRLSCTPTTLTKADRWFDIPRRRVFFRMQILAPIPARRYLGDGQQERFASRALNEHLIKQLGARDLG